MQAPIRATALIPLLFLLCLTGCGTAPPPPPEIQVERLHVPDSLLHCLPRPTPPASRRTDRTLGLYLVALAERGEDCSQRLDRVRALVTPAPAAAP